MVANRSSFFKPSQNKHDTSYIHMKLLQNCISAQFTSFWSSFYTKL